MNDSDMLNKILTNHNPSFNKGFAVRVIEQIEIEDLKDNIEENDIMRMFSWFAISGAVAIILLFISIYMSDGTFASDAIYGLFHYSPDEPILTSLNY